MCLTLILSVSNVGNGYIFSVLFKQLDNFIFSMYLFVHNFLC